MPSQKRHSLIWNTNHVHYNINFSVQRYTNDLVNVFCFCTHTNTHSLARSHTKTVRIAVHRVRAPRVRSRFGHIENILINLSKATERHRAMWLAPFIPRNNATISLSPLNSRPLPVSHTNRRWKLWRNRITKCVGQLFYVHRQAAKRHTNDRMQSQLATKCVFFFSFGLFAHIHTHSHTHARHSPIKYVWLLKNVPREARVGLRGSEWKGDADWLKN